MMAFRGVLLRNIQYYAIGSTKLYRPTCFTSYQAQRSLFSHEKLGLERFQRTRQDYFDRMTDLKGKFCEEVRESMVSKNPVVFTADLKVMIHLAENTDDLVLLEDMIKLYQKQQTDLSFAQFQFGPLVMRLLMHLQQPEKALELFLNEGLLSSGFFDQMSTYTVLLNMLYDTACYDDMHRVMDVVSSRQLAGILYPVDCVTLAVAACLKQNTEDSYNKMLSYVKGARSTGQDLSHRAIVHATLLAINQGKYVEAMELVELAALPKGRKREPLALINIKLLAYSKVGKTDRAIAVLREILETDVPDHLKTGSEIFQSMLSEVKSAVVAKDNKDLFNQYETLEQGLRQGNHIVDADFNEYIFRKIINRRNYQDGFKQRQHRRKEYQYDNRRT